MKLENQIPKRYSNVARQIIPRIAREGLSKYVLPFLYDIIEAITNLLRHTPRVLTKDGIYIRGLDMLKSGKKSIVVVNTVLEEGSQKYVLAWKHAYQKEYFEELFRIVQKNRHGIGTPLPIIRYTNLNDEQKCEEAISLLMHGSNVEIYHSAIPIEFLIRDDEQVLLGFPELNELKHGVQLRGKDVCATLNKWIADQSGIGQKTVPVPIRETNGGPVVALEYPEQVEPKREGFTKAQAVGRRIREMRNDNPSELPDHSLLRALDLLAKIGTEDSTSAAKKAFNTFYDWYPYLYEGEKYGHCYLTLAQYVKRVTNRQHPTFLDVGCAHGLGAEILYDNGIRYWGVDVSEVLIQKARERERHETFVVDDMIKVLLDYGGYFRWLGRGKQPLNIPDELDMIACQGNTFDFFLGDLQKWFALTLFRNRLRPRGMLFITQRSFTKGEGQVKRKAISPGGEADIVYNLDWSGDFVKLDVEFANKHLGSVVQHPTDETWLLDTCEKAGFERVDLKEEFGDWFGPRGGRPYKVFIFRLKN